MNKNNYEWDLEAILEGESLEDLYQKWLKQIDNQINVYPNIFDCYENFESWILNSDKLQRLSNRLSNYISNNRNINMTDAKWIGWGQKTDSDINRFSQTIADYENRILENKEIIKEFLKNPKINEYMRSFEMTLRYEPHILSTVEEQLLSKLSRADGGVDSIFDTLTTSDIKYQDAIDSKNKAHPLPTMSDVFVLLKSKDRTLRKSAWMNFQIAFYNFRNTLTQSLYYNFLELNTCSEIRKHEDYISSVCFSDEVDVKLIPHIYKQVGNYKGIHEKFSKHRNKLLKELLGVDKLEPWDGNVDLCHKEVKFDIEEAKQITLDCLKPLGGEYLSVVEKAFNERWISWLPKENKYTGAYSIGGTKGLNKFYILMNYDNTLNSVSTLVHELGHSLNSYFYTKAQKIYSSVSIFTAEVASITNEMLLNHYLLNKYKDDKEMTVMILDELISGFFATTSRQIIFSNFEYEIIQKIKNSEPITYESIESLYKEMNLKYMYISDPSSLDKMPNQYSLVTPLRISHFYAGNFYVYKYSIGQIVGCIIADRIIKGEDGAIENYMKFLSSGTSLSPIETIKLLGIDLYEDKPWEEAGLIIEAFIEQFLLVKSIKKPQKN
ncbi:MAG: oligoendopeptidase F [Mycoplasma sp.]